MIQLVICTSEGLYYKMNYKYDRSMHTKTKIVAKIFRVHLFIILFF